MTPMFQDAIVYVVDDDADLGSSVARLLRRHGFSAEPFVDPVALLEEHARLPAHCVVSDIMMGELDGFGFADRLRALDASAAILFMTVWPTTANAVDSIRRHGGLDYLEKPIAEDRLLAAVAEGVAWSRAKRRAEQRLSALTPREREVFDLLVLGHPNKMVADLLGLSPRTVEDHRAAILAKTGSNGLAQLIAMAG